MKKSSWIKRLFALLFSPRSIPLLLIALAIFITSSIPSKSLPHYPFPHFDKVVHAVFYSLLALGFSLVPGKKRWRRYGWKLLLFSVLGTALFGAFDEWRQSFVPGRVSSFADWMVDFVFGLMVSFLFWLRMHCSKKNGSKSD